MLLRMLGLASPLIPTPRRARLPFRSTISLSMTLVDRVNRQRSLTATARARRSGRIAANADVATTTYSYDANGNLVQAGSWNYMWDCLNRMLASGYNNSTTTYAYDEFGSRVMQTSTTSTTYYPNKYFSMMSTIVGSTTYATSTNYIWNGDTLLATIDQKLINGSATGTPITRFIHPDHLGSTNVVTDQNGSLVQLQDYYPYGATRIATSSYPTNEKRQYIDQFSDSQNGLNYLNARYYNATQGQFLSEDPVFWGEPKQQNLGDPQSLDTYSYSADNPITKKDPSGKCLEDGCVVEATALGGFAGGVVGFGSQYVSDVNKNIGSNGLSLRDFYNNLSPPSDYANSTGKGVIVGGATALSSIAGLGYYLVGITAGGSTAVTDYLGDLATRKKTDWGSLAWELSI